MSSNQHKLKRCEIHYKCHPSVENASVEHSRMKCRPRPIMVLITNQLNYTFPLIQMQLHMKSVGRAGIRPVVLIWTCFKQALLLPNEIIQSVVIVMALTPKWPLRNWSTYCHQQPILPFLLRESQGNIRNPTYK